MVQLSNKLCSHLLIQVDNQTSLISQDTIHLLTVTLFIILTGRLGNLLVGYTTMEHGQSLVSQILVKSILILSLALNILVLVLLLYLDSELVY